MSTHYEFMRQELMKEIRSNICQVIHRELTSLAHEIQNSHSQHEPDDQNSVSNKLNNWNQLCFKKNNHFNELDKKRKPTTNIGKSLSGLNEYKRHAKKISGIKRSFDRNSSILRDSDASNDSSIVLSNLKTLVSNKKSKHSVSIGKKQSHKEKCMLPILGTYSHLENIDSVVQDDLYKAIVTTHFEKSNPKTGNNRVIQMCNVCNYSSASKRAMRRHESGHEFDKSKGHALLRFELDEDMPSILRNNKIKHQLICHVCDFTTHRRKLMKNHKKLHKGVLIKHEYDFIECSDSFPFDQIKQTDVNNDFRDSNIFCKDDCNDFEKKNTHKNEDAIHSCNQCNYECKNLTLLTSHKLIHNTYTQFACGKCEFSSVSRSDLMKHKRDHKTLTVL